MSELQVDKLQINQLGFVGQDYLTQDQTKSLLTPAAAAGAATGKDFTKEGSHILFQCDNWGGSIEIPASKLGKYMAYEIKGTIGYWSQYCSMLTFSSAGACGGACADTFKAYCCTHMSCGWIGDTKCNNGSESWQCAGAIQWPFGCSSGCMSACSLAGFNFHVGYYPMAPNGPHSSVGKIAQYCVATSHGPGGGEFCCIGVRNSGRICMCCGGDASCLTGACFTTQSGGANAAISCCSTVVVIGHGKIDV
jgi:hypothetical protein